MLSDVIHNLIPDFNSVLSVSSYQNLWQPWQMSWMLRHFLQQQLKTRACLGHVTPIGWTRSVYKSIVECRFLKF